MQLHHTFRFQFSHFVLELGLEKVQASRAVHLLLLDFTGCPLITPPPPLFRIKLLHHSSHYDRISPNTTKQLPPPSLPGREDRGIIKLSDTHAPCMHMTQTVQATVLFLAQLYLPVNFQTSLAVNFHLL